MGLLARPNGGVQIVLSDERIEDANTRLIAFLRPDMTLVDDIGHKPVIG